MVYSLATFLMVLICSDMYIWSQTAAQGYDDLASAITPQCSGNDLTIHLLSSLLPTFDHTNFHLRNKTCRGNQLNDTHISLKTKLDECGTITQTYNDSVIFNNILQGHLKDNRSDSKNITTKLTVECKIRNIVSTTNVGKSVSINEIIETKVQSSVNTSVPPSMKTEVRSSAKRTVKPLVLPSIKTDVRSSAKPAMKPSMHSIKTKVRSSVKPKVNSSVQLSMNFSATLSVKMSVQPSVRPNSLMKSKEQKSMQDKPVSEALTQGRQDSSKNKGNRLFNKRNLKQRFEGKPVVLLLLTMGGKFSV